MHIATVTVQQPVNLTVRLSLAHCCDLLLRTLCASHCHKTNEANIPQDTDAEVITKSLADLNAVAYAAVGDVIRLDCAMAPQGLLDIYTHACAMPC